MSLNFYRFCRAYGQSHDRGGNGKPGDSNSTTVFHILQPKQVRMDPETTVPLTTTQRDARNYADQREHGYTVEHGGAVASNVAQMSQQDASDKHSNAHRSR